MFTLTHTNMSTFRDCPFKFKASYIDSLRPVVVKDSLKIGSAFHLYREGGQEAVDKYFGQFFPSTQEEADKLETQKAIVAGLTSLAPDEPDVIREVEWLNPLINPATGAPSKTFNLGGKADGVLALSNGTSALIEEKTTGASPSRSDIDKLSIDNQVMNCIVNLADSHGTTVSTVIYRYYRKPSIRQRQGETVEQYCERLLEDYEGRPEFYYHEERLIFPQPQLEGFRNDLWQVGKAILWFRRYDLWYRNTSHCIDWGGCPYLPLCRGENVDGLYKVGTPNPELTKEESHEQFAGIEV